MKNQNMKSQHTATPLLALALLIFAVLACRNFGGDSSGGTSNASADLSTPTKTYATMMQAMREKDVELYKKVLSKRYLDMATNLAKRQNRPVDDFLRDSLNVMPSGASFRAPETRNEKINGNTATLEQKARADWTVIQFVKEDDGWKVDPPAGL